MTPRPDTRLAMRIIIALLIVSLASTFIYNSQVSGDELKMKPYDSPEAVNDILSTLDHFSSQLWPADSASWNGEADAVALQNDVSGG